MEEPQVVPAGYLCFEFCICFFAFKSIFADLFGVIFLYIAYTIRHIVNDLFTNCAHEDTTFHLFHWNILPYFNRRLCHGTEFQCHGTNCASLCFVVDKGFPARLLIPPFMGLAHSAAFATVGHCTDLTALGRHTLDCSIFCSSRGSFRRR